MLQRTEISHTIMLRVILIGLFMLTQSLTVSAVESLPLIPGESSQSVIPFVQYLEDPTLSLTLEDVCCSNPNHRFQSLDHDEIDFGFSASRIWLKIPIVNEGNQAASWFIAFKSRFMTELKVYLKTDSGIKRLLEDSDKKTFSQRLVPYRFLTGILNLDAKQQGELIIAYYSKGATALPFTFEAQQDFYWQLIHDASKNFAFYAAMLLLLLLALFQFIILKSTIQLSFAGYTGASLLYIFHMDGLSFQYLWPNWPEWNAAASLYVGLNINIFAITFARAFLNTRKNQPRFDRLLQTLFWITIAVMLLGIFGDERYMKKFAFLVTTGGTLLCLLSGVIARFKGQRSARFYIAGWIGLAFGSVYTTLGHWFPGSQSLPLTFDISKLCIGFDVLMFSMAMADQTNDIRKQRDESSARERDLLERELESHKQMNLLEQQYKQALSLAEQKSLQLASAGHDLRQPIIALRMAMQKIYDHQATDPSIISQFRRGFDYIEQMITQFLDLPEQKVETTVPSHPDQPEVDNETERFPIQIILDNVKQMFEQEALEKGLSFHCVSSSVKIEANPVIVMRIISNLVGNAVKYTEAGRVLLGCRRRNGCIEIQVCDTGPGFTEQEKERAFLAYQRGDHTSTEGSGLGLNIVSQLCQQHHYPLCLHSSPQKGSLLSVRLPIVPLNNEWLR